MSARRRLSRAHDQAIGEAVIPLAMAVCRVAEADKETDAERAYNFLFEAAVVAADMLKPGYGQARLRTTIAAIADALRVVAPH